MTIDWVHFTPGSALAGGALIGVAAAMLVLLNGRVAGVSGIARGLLAPRRGDVGWRAAFVLGLVAAPLAWRAFGALPPIELPAGPAMSALAGVVVGWGTAYGGGCTSGHGVCGLSRLSLRSFVATLTFMATAFATVYVVRHGLGW